MIWRPFFRFPSEALGACGGETTLPRVCSTVVSTSTSAHTPSRYRACWPQWMQPARMSFGRPRPSLSFFHSWAPWPQRGSLSTTARRWEYACTEATLDQCQGRRLRSDTGRSQRGGHDLNPRLPRTARLGEIDATTKYAEALGRG